VGKTVVVRVGEREEPLTIVGLMNDMTVGQAYVPLKTAQELLGAGGQVNGLMGAVALPLERVKEGLFRHEEVKEIFSMADVRQAMDEYVGNLTAIARAGAGVGIGIALFFVLGSVLLNVLEREMEYATLRAIGYNRRRISGIVLTELMAEAAAGILLGIPVAVLLGFFINYRQGQIYFYIPTVIGWASLLGVSLWALVFIPLASVPGLRHLFRLKIAQVVREKVFG
jgi:putative ABC transport system permease protein